MLESALAAGVAAAGGDALLGGVLPTPAAAILVKRLGLDLAVVVSASHNPYRDNGIKFFSGAGTKLERRGRGRGSRRCVDAAPDGRARPAACASSTARWRTTCGRSRPPSRSTLPAVTVALDCANGATHRVAPAIFERLGADGRGDRGRARRAQHQRGLRLDPPRAPAPSTSPAPRPTIGFAFDGDGDRVLAVDGSGRAHDGDELIALAARGLDARGELGGGVAVTVMSNYGFHQAMEEAGIEVAVTTGRRPLRARRAPPARLGARRRAVRPHHRHPLRPHRRRDRGGADDDAGARRRRPRRLGPDGEAPAGAGQRRGRRPRGARRRRRRLGGGRAEEAPLEGRGGSSCARPAPSRSSG